MLILSCSSGKDILYMQDIDDYEFQNYTFTDYKISTDDILKIDIETIKSDIELRIAQNYDNNPGTKDYWLYEGLQVSSEGEIFLNDIGRLKVSGLTLDSVRSLIYNQLVDRGIYVDPTVDVKIVNKAYTILGEVNNPGNYFFQKNNFTILEAIGNAGDLTINGKRNNIKLIRESEGKRNVYQIDLTESEFLLSGTYQIFPRDIIIVSPNTNRIKNAGIIGNSGTLVSLLSFLLSSIILITN